MIIWLPLALLLLPLQIAALLAWVVRAVTQSEPPATESLAADQRRRASPPAWGP